MDIYQSSLSDYDKNKAGGSRTSISQTSSAKKANEASSNAQNTKPLQLKEGQVIKGQIIDQRFNEVKVQLEPGKQIITAKLSGNVAVSIGQEASFQVSQENSNQLVLKYLPTDATTAANSTVIKALTASGLPVNATSQAIVTELLNHTMPVDKQTLQLLMKASFQNREASPLTLVLMLKNNLPLTKENIAQFEAYQNGTGKLMQDINTITKNIVNVLEQATSGLTDSQTMLTSQNSVQSAMVLNDALINILNPGQFATSKNSTELTLNHVLNQEELNALGEAIKQSIEEGTDSADTLPSNTSANQTANQTQQVYEGSLSIKDTLALLNQLSKSPDATVAPIIDKLLAQITPFSDTQQVSDLFNQQQRNVFVELLNDLPVSPELKNQITSGSLSVQKLLQELQQVFTSPENHAAIKLLKSPEYAKLLEEAFLQKWTLTPDKIAKKLPINELFQALQEDVEKLSHLAKQDNVSAETMSLGEPLKSLNNNLHFMKDLNEAFTYLQLPIQLKNQMLHSELYVYTDKKALKENPTQLSVLLHLTMKHLGALNVHVQMNHNQIQAKFSAEEKESGQIIAKNIPLLEEALNRKGYQITIQLDSYAKPDFTNDLIEERSSDLKAHRFTFDIRT